MTDVFERLEQVIRERRRTRPERSYVVRLLDGGAAAIGAKVTEEAAELVEAAASGDAAAVAHEAADLFFHAMVLLASSGVDLSAVRGELERRSGTSGLDEKESRGR